MTAPNVPSTPSKPTERGASTTGSQRDRRWTDTFFDDYRHPVAFPNGRPFTGEREFKSGVSEQSISAGFLQSDLQCGEYFCENPAQGQTPLERKMTLDSAWVAPFLLPGGKKYMAFNYDKKRISWRYSAFIADETSALARYWEAAAKAAGESDIIDPSRPDAVPFRIRTLLGSPKAYTNRIRLAQACIGGDPWIMGAATEPNEELVKLLGLGEVQYLGGMQLGDAAYVSVPTAKTAAPIATPEQVLNASPVDVAKMVADAVAQALAARDAADAAKKAANKERMAKVRAKKPTSAGSNAV